MFSLKIFLWFIILYRNSQTSYYPENKRAQSLALNYKKKPVNLEAIKKKNIEVREIMIICEGHFGLWKQGPWTMGGLGWWVAPAVCTVNSTPPQPMWYRTISTPPPRPRLQPSRSLQPPPDKTWAPGSRAAMGRRGLFYPLHHLNNKMVGLLFLQYNNFKIGYYDIFYKSFPVAQHSIVAASASHAWATLEGSVSGGPSTLSAPTAVAAALQQVRTPDCQNFPISWV